MSSSDLLSILVIIPESVKQGLSDGVYERVGGIIRNTANKKVIYWLRDAATTQSQLCNNIISKFPIGTATVVGAAFVYLERNFAKIHKQLNSIDIKLDAQNLSKVQSGFSLAKQAEQMQDLNRAGMTMNSALALLEEGRCIFENLLKNTDIADKQYIDRTFAYARLIITTRLGKARAFLWNGEYLLARQEVEALQLFAGDIYKTYRDYAKRRLDSRESAYTPIGVIKDGCLGKFPNEELGILLEFSGYLKGYLLEIDELQERGVPLKDIGEKLFLAQ